jgi:NADP-dependent 3-hydroxy acid dehydrogenase YdfG
MELAKKKAIVTGASRGLGAALAEALAVKGAIVYGLARNLEKLSIIRNKLGNSFIPVEMDITDQKALNTWVENTFSDFNIPDILINNAGVGYFNKTDQLPIEQWYAMINTNLNAVFYLTSSIVPMMKKNQNTCHIINIGSILGKFARAETAAYSATKYGIQGFSEALYKDLSKHKIKVSCVNPGSIDTHFFDDSGIYGHCNMLKPGDIAAMIVHILETPDNFLVDEITLRPLIERPPV